MLIVAMQQRIERLARGVDGRLLEEVVGLPVCELMV